MLKALFCVTLLFADVVVCKPDYLFDQKVDGWLKLHPVPATWLEAFKTCHYEGAVLASPINAELASVLQYMTNQSNLERPMFLGTTSLSQAEFMSIEGVPLGDLSITWGALNDNGGKTEHCLSLSPDGKTYITSCFELLPYICYKKKDKTTIFNNQCSTFDYDYNINFSTGSCYKYHKKPRSWWEAHRICIAEGGYLVIINDKNEADIVTGFMDKSKNTMSWEHAKYIGIHDRSMDFTFLTLHGEKVENVYNKWAPGQPDNKGVNLCGIIYPEGTLDDVHCGNENMKFICEKDPNDSRFERIFFKIKTEAD